MLFSTDFVDATQFWDPGNSPLKFLNLSLFLLISSYSSGFSMLSLYCIPFCFNQFCISAFLVLSGYLIWYAALSIITTELGGQFGINLVCSHRSYDKPSYNTKNIFLCDCTLKANETQTSKRNVDKQAKRETKIG